jgi:hypothetical protein
LVLFWVFRQNRHEKTRQHGVGGLCFSGICAV